MKRSKAFCLAICLVLSLALGTAHAQVVYTCDPSVGTSTCTYLNTTVAGRYSKTFSNANVSIYITYGDVGLGQSSGGFGYTMTYTEYIAALKAIPNPSPVQTAALLALSNYAAGPYGAGNVLVNSALGTVLGLTGLQGTMSDGTTACPLPSTGCYDKIVTLSNHPDITFYYINLGGTEPNNAYDVYTTVEHETNEALGTSSCIGTADGSAKPAAGGRTKAFKTVKNPLATAANPAKATLSDFCGAGVPSPVDLFRYSGAGSIVPDSSLSTKDGAFFSFDGGVTNGANGDKGNGKKYNTKANGDDYADFVSNADCSINEAVQDAEGCPGQDAGLTILNDGQGEINILNAVGYNLAVAPSQPVTANKPLLHFGQVVFPATTPVQDGVDLTNNGTTDVAIGAVSITFTYGDVSQFTFDSSACVDKDKNTGTLKAGKKCHIAVSFNPDAVEVSRATLLIPTTPGSTISIPLTGAGIDNTQQ